MNAIFLRNILFFLFALSGFSGLIYESIWTHYLKLFLGHAAYAQTLVLAIFMGGMALGSWICSRYSARWPNLLLAYALAETLIGIMALLFHDSFDTSINFAYDVVIPAIGSVTLITVLKWMFASLFILPQSILLGMTFPLMSAGIIRRFPHKPGATVAMLYFTNSIGGAIGVLVSGFVLINWVGLPGTILVAGCINIVLAGFVWLLVKSQLEPQFLPAISAVEQTSNHSSIKIIPLLLITALLTGMASFVYEIGWIRMLSMVLGSSTHAFELMLSAFIFGLAFGGLWIRFKIDRIADSIRFLAIVQLLMGLFALSTLLLYGNSFHLMHWLISALPKTDSGYILFNIASHGIALAIMLPTTFCAGTTLPIITYTLIKHGVGERSIGAVYGMNTVGAIIGVFLTIHWAMPYLGLKAVITLGASIDIAVAIVLAWWLKAFTWQKLPTTVTALGLCAIVVVIFGVKLDTLTMASAVYRSAELLDPHDAVVVKHQDGKTATIDLTKQQHDFVSIRSNGKPDATIYMGNNGDVSLDEATMTLAAAVPLMLHPNAKTAANIGMGSGLTTHVMLTAPTLERVDTIEIERAMVDVAQGFRPRNELAYTDQRSHIYIEDAKTFFSTRNRHYDIIVSEPSNPWVSGNASLFTEEFYQLVTRHLNKQGIFVQWVQLYEINVDLVVSMLKALEQHFDDFVIFAPNAGDILIVAKNNGVIPFLDGQLLRNKKFAFELNRLGFNTIQDFEFRRVVNKRLLKPMLADYTIAPNSDYFPIVDQNAARARFLKSNALDILSINQEPLPTLEILGIFQPSWNNTQITPNKAYPRSIDAFLATKIRDQLLGLVLNNLGGANRQYITKTASEYASLFRQCDSLPLHGDRVYVVLDMMLKLVAYLRPYELDAIWSQLNINHCKTVWNQNESQWLDLMTAVGRRDSDALAAVALTLLNRNELMTPARKKYLVAAAMLGHIAQNQHSTALAIWSRFASELFPDQAPRMMFRILAQASKSS